jgi:hypothetical protein
MNGGSVEPAMNFCTQMEDFDRKAAEAIRSVSSPTVK